MLSKSEYCVIKFKNKFFNRIAMKSIFVFLLLIILVSASAQVRTVIYRDANDVYSFFPEFRSDSRSISQIPVKNMPSIDPNELLSEDRQEEEISTGPFRFYISVVQLITKKARSITGFFSLGTIILHHSTHSSSHSWVWHWRFFFFLVANYALCGQEHACY